MLSKTVDGSSTHVKPSNYAVETGVYSHFSNKVEKFNLIDKIAKLKYKKQGKKVYLPSRGRGAPYRSDR